MKQQTAESKTAHEKIQEIISLLTNSAMRKLSEEDDVIHAINAFGLLAKATGITWLETLMMSMFVFAGAAQYMSLNLIALGTGGFEIIFTTCPRFRRYFTKGR